ncbi:CapA family protein [Bacillus sp. HMF5848]|uniref:CapA family protein n=1 Tax=Bacillus sp. HMF5848 TaxID=2495421 RepID=UPI000F77EEC7|nr:CapA family protein [Bacillus sp. HMF5848]RSK26769.1 CapA family protein [Bacillus sp. HMF5848]
MEKWIYITIVCLLLSACSDRKEQLNVVLPENETMLTEEPESMEQIEELEPIRDKEPLTFSFAGDTMAAGKVAAILQQEGYEYPWQQAKNHLVHSDITMLNLETPVTTICEPASKKYSYQSHPDLLKGMKFAGVDIVTVANNHALDCGEVGLIETIKHLRKAGILYVGGGEDMVEAYSAREIDVRGQRVSIVGFSRVLPDVSWYAGTRKPGLSSGYQDKIVLEKIQEAAMGSDFTVVYMHWGIELADVPEDKDRQLAHQMIDAGADMIIGSHPHVLQGFEFYKGKLIAYSLGNFIFTMSHQDIARQTGVLNVKVHESGKQEVTFTPMRIQNGAVWITEEEESQAILKRLNSISISGQWNNEGVFTE